jgi:hypothetical protein
MILSPCAFANADASSVLISVAARLCHDCQASKQTMGANRVNVARKTPTTPTLPPPCPALEGLEYRCLRKTPSTAGCLIPSLPSQKQSIYYVFFMQISTLLFAAASVVVASLVNAVPLPGCCTSKPSPLDDTSQRHIPTSKRNLSSKVSIYENTIVPNAGWLDRISSSHSSNGRSPSPPSSPRPGQGLKSSHYRRGSTLSNQALRNLNILPSDPLATEVDDWYGPFTSVRFKKNRRAQWEAREPRAGIESKGYRSEQKSDRLRKPHQEADSESTSSSDGSFWL